MKRILFLCLVALTVLSCNTKQRERNAAFARVDEARTLVQTGSLNAAKMQLDTVHLLYPRQVDARRAAKSLMDSITYIEACRTAAYADSLLQPLLPEVDKLVKGFNREKNGEYENYGRYVHKLLPTGRNTNRCFLQAYVNEDMRVAAKSYYYGAAPVNQQAVTLSVGDEVFRAGGANHAFEAEGRHEILTLDEPSSLGLLAFVSAHKADRLKVTLNGTRTYVYYLSQQEKQALEETFRLAVSMKDVRRLEDLLNTADRQMKHYESKTASLPGQFPN